MKTDRERREHRETGKDYARRYLLQVVRGDRRIKVERDRILAARSLLIERAEASQVDTAHAKAEEQRKRFGELLAALNHEISPLATNEGPSGSFT